MARSLSRSLFEERKLTRAVSAEAPALDVEVSSFEEIKVAGKHAVRIEVRIVLADLDAALLEETVVEERPVRGEGAIDDVVAAMAAALDAICDDVAARVERALAPRR